MGLLNDSIEYRSLAGDDTDGGYESRYDVYVLDRVVVREVFSSDEDMNFGGGVTVYYFPEKSLCTDEGGCETVLPRPKYGDLCVLRQNKAEGKIMRVAEAGYFIDSRSSGSLSHIRLKLK